MSQPTTQQAIRAYNYACREHMLDEVYKLHQSGKLSSTNAKKLLTELTAKIKRGEYKPPLEYLMKWVEHEKA